MAYNYKEGILVPFVQKFYKQMIVVVAALFIASMVSMTLSASAAKPANTGFDEFGYNDGARVFVGRADGVDRILDDAVWGDATYANDHLKMKWNAEWDRGNDEGWSNPPYRAWEDNQWNGAFPGGSGEVYHFKTVWDAGCVADGVPSVGGDSYCLWNQFAVLMEHWTDADGHVWGTHALPAGYGSLVNPTTLTE
jgi:hypothetical protein